MGKGMGGGGWLLVVGATLAFVVAGCPKSDESQLEGADAPGRTADLTGDDGEDGEGPGEVLPPADLAAELPAQDAGEPPAEVDCQPDCTDQECGDDGCGGSCGACPQVAPLCIDGKCSLDCQPQCDNKECGPDGCGGSCGSCPDVAPLCQQGRCAFDCQPACTGKECGPDGCGGSCGECGGVEPICIGGQCLADCPASTCAPGDKKCVGPDHWSACEPMAPPCDDRWDWPGTTIECPAGTSCLAGECLAPALTCEAAEAQELSFGCAFVSVDLALYPDPYSPVKPDTAPHALLLANPGSQAATISFAAAPGVALGALSQGLTIGPGEVKTVPAPVMSLTGTGIFDLSLRISSDRPIAAWQVNPQDPQTAANDSSLLLPLHLLGMEYRVITRPTVPLEQFGLGMPSQHGYFAVIPVKPGATTLAIEVPVRTGMLTALGKKLEPGQSHQVTLSQWQVLQLTADGAQANGPYDLTGAVVTANQEVALFAGHEEATACGLVTDESCCADHLEEQLLPPAAWGTTHHCIKAFPRGAKDQDLWRVQAGAPGIKLTTVPAVPGLNGITLAKAGDWVESAFAESFTLISSGPVQVAQFLVGQQCAGSDLGDPNMILAVPASRYANHHLLAPVAGYSEHHATIVRSTGAAVTVAGDPIPPELFSPVGDGLYERAWVNLDQPLVEVECELPCAAYIYGYGPLSSYGHPAGLGTPQL